MLFKHLQSRSLPDELSVDDSSRITFALTTNIFQFNLHSVEDREQN